MCKNLPRLTSKTKKFRLVSSTCSHFVAISYCWPKHADGSPKDTRRTYVYHKPGAAAERPLDQVVDRAIQFAQKVGLRQFWIDVHFDDDGYGYRQMWLLHRIMNDGYVWCGKAIPMPPGLEKKVYRGSGDESMTSSAQSRTKHGTDTDAGRQAQKLTCSPETSGLVGRVQTSRQQKTGGIKTHAGVNAR